MSSSNTEVTQKYRNKKPHKHNKTKIRKDDTATHVFRNKPIPECVGVKRHQPVQKVGIWKNLFLNFMMVLPTVQAPKLTLATAVLKC